MQACEREIEANIKTLENLIKEWETKANRGEKAM